MKQAITKEALQNSSPQRKRVLQIALSFTAPLLILLLHPLGMNLRQSIVISSLLLTVIWWSTGWVKKVPASCFLLLIFLLFSGAPVQTIFSFPLSENFFLITLTYLFSQGIANSGLVNKLAQPVLERYANTPIKVLLAIVGMYLITMYMIPQPLARLIIVAVLFNSYLDKTDVPSATRSVLMFACFVFYAVVNMATRDADMIMNSATLGFAKVEMSDSIWIRYMAAPTAVYGLAVLGLFILLFRKQLLGIQMSAPSALVSSSGKLSRTDVVTLTVIAATMLIWMTGAWHGINATLVTAVSTGALFFLGVLHKDDLKAIDVTTLVFLTAAFSIGGVMKACGAADVVFSQLDGLFPKQYSAAYVATVVLVTMLMHMLLGSNTTTLSVVIPGLIVLCGDVMPATALMFTAYISVAFHSILPFHSVAMMIGSSNNYFPSKYVARLGIPVTVLVFLAALLIYTPWWNFLGLL